MTQAYNLSQLANNLNSTGQLDATDGLVNAVPIANGGTGASSAAGAMANLGPAIYPVGSIYINASVATNPSTLLGFGTWVAFGAGRVPISNGGGFTAGSTGGSADTPVVSHSHTGSTAAAGASTGSVDGGNPGDFGFVRSGTGVLTAAGAGQPNRPQGAGGSNGMLPTLNLSIPDHTHTVSVTATGVSGTNANLPPYIVVYMWQRTV